ncbi:MAG: DUF962 domain-containing protein [Steroidobacteraceae bacterium]|jgi:uncharacterized membrane protein YGL010W|nr:DUF962 domain-containing protein [Steroidobacteraceae bacterium]
MRTIDQWLEAYGESHRHPLNKALHWACVPAIVLSVLGLLGSAPVPAAFAGLAPWLDWAALVAALAILYYFALSPALALGMLPVIALLLAGVAALGRLPWPAWQSCLAIFVLAWAGQFAGHAVEGRRPSFFQDLQFLLIGPLWLLAAVYRALGLRYSPAPRARAA